MQQGQLVGICGGVGAGKSSLLSAVLGLMALRHGQVRVGSNVAYVAQQAWILSDTLRNNIVFGQVTDYFGCFILFWVFYFISNNHPRSVCWFRRDMWVRSLCAHGTGV